MFRPKRPQRWLPALVEGPEVLPVIIAVRWLKVVEARDGAHLLLSFDP